MRNRLLLTTALLAFAGAAHAQVGRAQTGKTPTSDVVIADLRAPVATPDIAGSAAANAVEQVVVVAGRRTENLDRVGQSVTVLTLPQIRNDQELVVSDILARTPGVSFSRNGGVGAPTQLRIRGAETDQTVVLIDGVKLNDPASTGGGYNFGDLLVGDISRIEVLRGPQSTLYGSQAVGGVVNIVTASPTKPFEGNAQVEGGSFATGYAKVAAGGKLDRLTLQGALSSYTTAGISDFDRKLGGREDDGYHNTALAARVGYEVTPNVSLDGRIYYAETRGEFDGFDTPTFSFGDDLEFGRTQQLVAYAGLNVSLLDSRLTNRLALQHTDNERQNYDPQQAVTPLTFDSSGINDRFEYQGAYQIADGYSLVFGAEHERSSFVTVSPSAFAPSPAATRASDTIDSGYGQLQAEVIHGLNLTGGVRYDDHSTFGVHATGQAAAAWRLNGDNTILRFSWGQGFKAPTLYQLYSQYGNAGLNPEQADGWDGGVEQRFWGGKAIVQATYFERDTTDTIVFVSCPSTGRTGRCVTQPFGYYNNVAKAHADGVELTGALKPLPGVEITGNYTYTDAEDRSPGASTYGRQLTRRPRDTANLEAAYTWPLNLRTAVAMRYAGASFDNAANTTRIKSYTITDLRASYPLPHGLELYARVENLFDKSYETIFRYGQPGRAGYAGLRVTF